MSDAPPPTALDRSREGDLDAFGELVRQHEGWIRGYLRARIRNWSAADDLAQDVFVTAFRRIRDFRGEAPFESWLRGIALNHLRNFIRKRREDCIGGSEELQALMDTEPHHADQGGAALDALRECLHRIDGPARELLDGRYVQGKSVRELADEVGRGYSALTMQLHRMREALADCVKKKLESPGT
ncbi:sigma-70 family RNA polymerase sigma factor [Luteolibacter sp. LG18]|uniref:sigma-70 family RNA polymerase sigma factor n=1 Tax=Luteolibacter sp. LG18 TaxID=2819286 RepID=UPI002B325BC5|nr:RNA polymerase sigma factor [Luteolibacter sp. LG18]